MRGKQKRKTPESVHCQIRGANQQPFAGLRNFVPLGGGEERIYREMREAVPVLDAAVGKLIRLTGGFRVKCRNPAAESKLAAFLKTVPCGSGQVGIDNFLTAYLDSLLTYGRAVGELVVAGGKLRGVCWGDVTQLEIQEGDSPLEILICGPDEHGTMRPLPYQNLLLFSAWHPEAGHPYGVSLFRGMPFIAGILMKIYNTIGENWERAGNIRYSVVCRDNESDGLLAQERGRLIADQWAKAMEDTKNGTVRDFVAVGDVEIKAIGSDAPILDAHVPVRLLMEQLIAKTGLPPFLLGLSWTTTERMSTQQADLLTSELWAIRRTVQPVLEKICRTFLATEGCGSGFEIVWDDISLQDITEQARAALYLAQAEKAKRGG